MDYEGLKYDLCIGCGEIEPKGLIPTIMHSCPKNQVNYWGSSFKLRHFKNLLSGVDELQSLKDLLKFPHFKAIKEIVHPLDEMLYAYARELEIKMMKRLRIWIDIEDEFNYKF